MRSFKKITDLNGKYIQRFLRLVERFSETKILVIGDWMLDEFVWGTVERISPEAPVPVVNVSRESFVPGGALNVANNIRTLGGCVYPCGLVGRDLRGRMLVKAMRKEGIDTSGAIYDQARPTTLKTRVVAHSQQVVRFDREDNRELSREHLQKALLFVSKMLPKVDAVIIEDYGKGMITAELLTGVLKETKRLGKPVLVDPKEKHFSYYKGVTAITPNRKEAFEAYGRMKNGRIPDIHEVGKGLLKQFSCQAVLITLGEEGMILFEQNGAVTKIPTAAQEVYDVSGAGDTVIAVFAMAHAAGATVKEAAILSNCAAGIVVGKLGTATLTQEELKRSLSNQSLSPRKRVLSSV
ncbi:MAG: D-glycero-beta-D-manno-heptose-7-phosphate kinase [Candidatus Omnitrophica bacterium]|nr:D-glycero-beta-D-manno-heptose-7-phosphate kinase [Candidatus Omnitrophota bacterium]